MAALQKRNKIALKKALELFQKIFFEKSSRRRVEQKSVSSVALLHEWSMVKDPFIMQSSFSQTRPPARCIVNETVLFPCLVILSSAKPIALLRHLLLLIHRRLSLQHPTAASSLTTLRRCSGYPDSQHTLNRNTGLLASPATMARDTVVWRHF